MRRAETLKSKDLHFIDVGTSGGIWGLRQGYCLMIGGDAAVVKRLGPLFESLAPAPDRGWVRVGPVGSGHFVKMVHNGIEYGLMQAYAEGFALLEKKTEFDLKLQEVAEVWRYGSVVRSWLLDLIAEALVENPGLQGIKAFVEDSGEGRWMVSEAIEQDLPAPVITLSLIERFRSRDADSFSDKLLAVMRHKFGGHTLKMEP
jgi:6-phosphogluconate dehydrogenase